MPGSAVSPSQRSQTDVAPLAHHVAPTRTRGLSENGIGDVGPTGCREGLHQPFCAHTADTQMTAVLDEDVLDEVLNDGLTTFRRNQPESQGHHVRGLRLARVVVALPVEEGSVKSGCDLLGGGPQASRLVGVPQKCAMSATSRQL